MERRRLFDVALTYPPSAGRKMLKRCYRPVSRKIFPPLINPGDMMGLFETPGWIIFDGSTGGEEHFELNR